MENRTSEIIDTKALFEDLRSQILKDGKVRFVMEIMGKNLK